MKQHFAAGTLASLATLLMSAAQAQETSGWPQSHLDTVQVTATRFGEQAQEVPMSISVVRGEELRARGATDLRTALSTLGGVSVAMGGDRGPAGAVPGLLGVREIDDLLLLIDGVPAGGAFFPTFEAVSLINVERIEVLRGTAPVYFGTTAFAGTINVVHYPAGQADANATLRYGSFGGLTAGAAWVLSNGEIRQSLSGEISNDPTADPRGGHKRAQLGYRAAMDLAGGKARMDLNVMSLRQRPLSPTPLNDSGHLATDLPIDFNQNPADAKLDTRRVQLVGGYAKTVSLGHWGTTLSITQGNEESIRGFLNDGFRDATGDNASGVVQSRRLTDVFFDTHLTDRLTPWLWVTYGLNELYGSARQSSQSFTYVAPLDGSAPAPSAAGTPTGTTALSDSRNFFGVYAQTRLRFSEDASALAGLRWNRTRETRTATDADNNLVSQSQRTTRFSGSLGGQLKVWSDTSGDLDDVFVHASVGNTFQPPQLDFAAEAGASPLLRPETQRSLVVGLKADGLDGRFDVDLSTFLVDFNNQPVTGQVGGNPVLTSGGSNRFTGLELESSFRLTSALTLAAHASYSDARYREFNTLVGTAMTQLRGNRLILTSKVLAGAHVTFAPAIGWGGSLAMNYAGPRFLDTLNTVEAGGYAVVDASLAYHFGRYTLSLAGSNLTNRRDPILRSELGEGQLYRMPGRRVFASLSMLLK